MVDKETHPTIYKHHQNLNLFTISNRKNICIKDISIFNLLSNISLQVSSVINLISKLLFKANPLLNLTFIISSNINHSHRSKKKNTLILFVYLFISNDLLQDYNPKGISLEYGLCNVEPSMTPNYKALGIEFRTI